MRSRRHRAAYHILLAFVVFLAYHLKSINGQEAIFAGAARPELLADLTEREPQILQHVGLCQSNAEIAGDLYICPATARAYISRILTKLAAIDRSQLVVIAYESGLIQPGQKPKLCLPQSIPVAVERKQEPGY